MSNLGPPPQSGEDVDTLWRYVAELYAHIRALENMTVKGSIPGIPTIIHGDLQVGSTNCVLRIQ
jgi:hypothetical protein